MMMELEMVDAPHLSDEERMDIIRKNIRMAVSLRETNFAEVARKAGLSRNAVSQFVSKKTSISHQNLLKVCDVLNVPVSLLHIPDSMTEGRIKLQIALEKLPPHLIEQAIAEAKKSGG